MRSIFISDIKESYRSLFSRVGDVIAAGRRAYIIIPDQSAVTVEREMSYALPASAQLYCDTVGFRRLANNIFRRYGGLCYNYADRGAETLIMWRAMNLLRDSLSVYRDSVSLPSGAPVMLSAITELKQSMVTPDALMSAALRLEAAGDPSLPTAKYIDIANIYAAYNRLLGESFDDKQSELSAAAELLHTHDFFSGCEVFVFAFSGFTAQQYAILRGAARQADDMIFIFPTPCEMSPAAVEFDGLYDTDSRIAAMAGGLRLPYTREYITPDSKSNIKALVRSLWSGGTTPPGCGGNNCGGEIILDECPTLRAEVEAAAVMITAAVRDGCRYRDIAVCVGSPDTYRGIIEDAFDEFSIPYHMSVRHRVEAEASASALLSALRVVCGGWNRHDIISYIKSGYSGISADEADELEIYMQTWNIGGVRFRSPAGGQWSMNPDGYTSQWSEEGAALLSRVNRARAVVAEPLDDLYDAMSDKTDAAVKTAAISSFYDTLCESGPSSGSPSAPQARELLLRALNTVELCSAPGAISSQDYFSGFKLALDAQSTGTIPSRVDEVDICTAAGMRGSSYLHVIMLGCADGEFPAESGDGSLFSDTEKIALEGEGVSIGGRSALIRATELYNFSRAAAMAEKSLSFIYRRGQGGSIPSVISRITELFPDIVISRHLSSPRVSDIYTPDSAARVFTRLRGASAAAVSRALDKTGLYSRVLRSLDTPISDIKEKIPDEVAQKLFGGDIALSQSRLESYVLCGFGFYCNYILGLREEKRAAISYADIGVFIHSVLERVFAAGLSPDAGDDELRLLADEIISDYIRELCPPEEAENQRLRKLFHRLRRSVLIFIRACRDEFAQSAFKPVLFEAAIGKTPRGGDAFPPVSIPTEDGHHTVMRGIADRIDSYRDNDGKLWIRVVDYKTGQKKFSPDDISLGLNLQLPLYLYSVCSAGVGVIPVSRLGGEPGDVVVPAGFLYIGVRPQDDAGSDTDIPDATAPVSRHLPRSGLLCGDPSVLRAMEPALSGEYIPVKLKADGTLTVASRVSVTADGFGDDENSDYGFTGIFDEMSAVICRISSRLRSGDASAVPLRAHGSLPCDYCGMRAVCRRPKQT